MLGASLPPSPILCVAALIGFLGYGVSLVLFVLALRHLGTARSGAYFSMAPFMGALLAIALFGEPITVTLLLAGVLMAIGRSEEHTSELQSLMRNSYAVFCLKKKKKNKIHQHNSC